MSKKPPHSNVGNQHAAKPPSQRKGTTLALRCRSADRAKWQKLADDAGLSLNAWANRKLNSPEQEQTRE